MLSASWVALFKLHRKIYRVLSPIICYMYSTGSQINLHKTLLIGFPYLSGKITIQDGGILVSLINGNELGVISPCRFTALNGRIIIGKNFQASGLCIFSNSAVTIGDNVMTGANCTIIDDDMHPVGYLARLNNCDRSSTKPINIEDNVWLGSNVTVLKGVTIGARSVVGSGVVLRRSIPPDTMIYHSNSQLTHKQILS